MKWDKKDVNGILISKDVVDPLEYTQYKLMGHSTPDKRWIPLATLHDIAWLFMSEPNKILSKIKSDLKNPQLKNIGARISDKLSENVWVKYNMPETEKYAKYFGMEFIRLYRARRNKTIKVLTKIEDCILMGTFDKEYEFDVFKIIQWLADWDEETSIYNENTDNFKKYAKALINYKEKDKLFNMHFGEEYDDKDKKNFIDTLHDIYAYIKAESPQQISVAMLKGQKNKVVLEANI
jgi:hypothetical protein